MAEADEVSSVEAARIAEIRARAEAANAGPWFCGDDGWPYRDFGRSDPYEGMVEWWVKSIDDRPENPYRPYEVSFETLDFVAHAREDIPYLLNALAEARKEAEARLEVVAAEIDLQHGLNHNQRAETCGWGVCIALRANRAALSPISGDRQ